jgi:hypothetical protein
MELTLAHLNETEISVTCDGQHSHTFDLRKLTTNREIQSAQSLIEPVAYGKAVYLALFPLGSPARQTLESMPERILLLCPCAGYLAYPFLKMGDAQRFSIVLVYNFLKVYASIFDFLQ